MILQLNPESGKMTATLSHEGREEQYECLWHACENPACTCAQITLELYRPYGRDQDAAATEPPPRSVEIDLITSDIVRDKNRKDSFAKTFIKQLDEGDFELLRKIHFAYKNELTRATPDDAIEPSFDYDAIESEGTMYAYNEVLPHGDQLIFFMGDKRFVIIDMHCLIPKCSCTETILMIGHSEDDSTPEIDISVDFKKKTWQLLESKNNRLSLESARSAIEEQIPDLYQQLRDRQARLKSIYKHCRRKNYRPEPRITSDKIGRNDPCFCGSGKKYKKCCMK
jgi:hypothetical protein